MTGPKGGHLVFFSILVPDKNQNVIASNRRNNDKFNSQMQKIDKKLFE